VASYVPAEILAAYLTLLPIVLGQTKSGTERTSLLAVILFGLVIINVFYLIKIRDPGQQRPWTQIVVSTVAYLVWTYSITGGFWSVIGIYQSALAAIFMVFFSLISGAFIPHETGAKQQDAQQQDAQQQDAQPEGA
jgi:hypothetical protein